MNNCETCKHKKHAEPNAHCYMFEKEPEGVCGHHSKRVGVVGGGRQQGKALMLALMAALAEGEPRDE